jgi:hypothetical protein
MQYFLRLLYRAIWSLGFLFLIWSGNLRAENLRDSMAKLNTRIADLETRIKKAEDYREVIEKIYEQRVEQIKSNHAIYLLELERKIFYIYSGGVIVVLLVSAGAYQYFFKIPEIIRQGVDKELQKHMDFTKDQLDQLNKFIESKDVELKLKTERKILVLTSEIQPPGSLNQIQEYLQKTGFKRVDFRMVEGIHPEEITKYNMLLIYDEPRFLTPDFQANEKIEQIARKLVESPTDFIYSGSQDPSQIPVLAEIIKGGRLNASRSKYTLYNQMLITLKYQYLMSSNS